LAVCCGHGERIKKDLGDVKEGCMGLHGTGEAAVLHPRVPYDPHP
jgi:hypothetical protein